MSSTFYQSMVVYLSMSIRVFETIIVDVIAFPVASSVSFKS